MTRIEPPLVFVLPGGGYANHASHEAEPVADWLATLGFEARVIRYPVAPERHPKAFDIVRAEILAAKTESNRPVGVLGFSAGGHLAGEVALSPADDPRSVPDFAVLGYPVVALGAGGHIASRDNLLGDRVEIAESLSLQNLVTKGAPPFFIWHTADDAAVPVDHSLRLAAALAAVDVPFELHVFPKGSHGLGLALEAGPPAAWTGLCATWLRGILRPDAHATRPAAPSQP